MTSLFLAFERRKDHSSRVGFEIGTLHVPFAVVAFNSIGAARKQKGIVAAG